MVSILPRHYVCVCVCGGQAHVHSHKTADTGALTHTRAPLDAKLQAMSAAICCQLAGKQEPPSLFLRSLLGREHLSFFKTGFRCELFPLFIPF